MVAFLSPATNGDLLRLFADQGITAIAVEAVPRITRAQSMDALSAMANLAGYRAVVEAADAYCGFFSGQMTAAGMMPPAKILIIGAGVAGLAAVGAAKGLGAIVRAFDTRAATKEQVESLGGEFLTVELEEAGEGGGGYAKEMSKAFLDAEFALFREQAKEVDIVITTALIPGKPAPKLWHKDMVEAMRPGSVVVDLAGEQGGNCEYTVPHESTVVHGVTILGYTNLPSRMGRTASTLYANVVLNLWKHLGGAEPKVDFEDEITRAMTVTHQGDVTWPPPKPPAPPTPAPAPKQAEPAPKMPAKTASSGWPAAIAGVILAGIWLWARYAFNTEEGTGDAAQAFVQHLTVFIMACFVGWHVIWNVSPALHTPLMAVTNAISGIILVGGLLMSGQPLTSPDGALNLAVTLGLAASLLAMINVAGGFLVTQRMLKMFRKDG